MANQVKLLFRRIRNGTSRKKVGNDWKDRFNEMTGKPILADNRIEVAVEGKLTNKTALAKLATLTTSQLIGIDKAVCDANDFTSRLNIPDWVEADTVWRATDKNGSFVTHFPADDGDLTSVSYTHLTLPTNREV